MRLIRLSVDSIVHWLLHQAQRLEGLCGYGSMFEEWTGTLDGSMFEEWTGTLDVG